jgi:hypothetical protein
MVAGAARLAARDDVGEEENLMAFYTRGLGVGVLDRQPTTGSTRSR